jgi:hypothetical protein
MSKQKAEKAKARAARTAAKAAREMEKPPPSLSTLTGLLGTKSVKDFVAANGITGISLRADGIRALKGLVAQRVYEILGRACQKTAKYGKDGALLGGVHTITAERMVETLNEMDTWSEVAPTNKANSGVFVDADADTSTPVVAAEVSEDGMAVSA